MGEGDRARVKRREGGGGRVKKNLEHFAELSRLDCISLHMMVVYYVACVLHLLLCYVVQIKLFIRLSDNCSKPTLRLRYEHTDTFMAWLHTLYV